MPRTNKKTRIKGVPPRLQLQQKDARTGSFSSPVRIASDNRTGKYPINWNDRNAIVFGEQDGDFAFRTHGNFEDWTAERGFQAQWRFAYDSLVSGSAGESRVFRAISLNPFTQLDSSNWHLVYSGSEIELVEDVPWRGLPVPFNEYSLRFSPSSSNICTNGFVDPTSRSGSFDNLYTQLELLTGNGGILGNYLSIGCWVKLEEQLNAGEQGIIAQRGGSISEGFPPHFVFWVDANRNVGGTVYWGGSSNSGIYATSSLQLEVGKWHFVNMLWGSTGSIRFVGDDGTVENPTMSEFGKSGPVNNEGFDIPLHFGRGQADHTRAGVTWTAFPGLINSPMFYLSSYPMGNTNFETLPGGDRVRWRAAKDVRGRLVEDHVVGINLGGGWSPNEAGFLESSEQVTTLWPRKGSVRKGVGDSIAHFTPGQDLTPFRDNNQPAVDGKSSGNPFYATGSNPAEFGTALQQPLWSKTKIEIPILVSGNPRIQFVTGSPDDPVGSYDCAYYNHENKTWQGIGGGRKVGSYQNATHALVSATLGFTPAFYNFGNQVQAGRSAYLTHTFGFPYHPKFHATSSQAIAMSDYISEPFLVEKIVMDLSATFDLGYVIPNLSINSFEYTSSINSFVLLAQRNVAGFSVTESTWNMTSSADLVSLTSTTPVKLPLTADQSNLTDVSSIRSIVTIGQVSSFGLGELERAVSSSVRGVDSQLRDINITSSLTGLSGVNWSEKIKFELPARVPLRSLQGTALFDYRINDEEESANTSGYISLLLDNKNGGRNGLLTKITDGRSFRGEFVPMSTVADFGVFGLPPTFPGPGDGTRLGTPLESPHQPNPFILQPNDSLVLAWFLPVPDIYSSTVDTNGSSSNITFHPGEYKLTLYGSRISNNAETHDTLNQLLTSEAVHEVIGND